MSTSETTPCIISVIEDEKKFLVRIPPPHRERAKKLSGRQWDPKKQAWVYEKTYYNYQQLYKEFQKDAVEFDLTEPEQNKSHETEPLNKSKSSDNYDEKISNDDVICLKKGLGTLIETIEDQQSLLKEQTNQIESLRYDFKQRSEPDETRTLRAEMCDQFLREMFKSGIGEHAEINIILNRYDFFAEQLTVLNRLEEQTKKQLRFFLDVDAEERVTLNNLIRDAFESEAITPQTRSLLDAFRRQRNSIVHDDETPLKKYIRYVSALSSLSLAWTDISMDD